MTPSNHPSSLTILQKRAITDEYFRRKANGEPSTQADLAEWAMRHFELTRRPHQSSISRFIRDAPKLSLTTSATRKRTTGSQNTQLEAALFSWITAQYANRRTITGDLIKSAGRRIRQYMNEKLPQDRQISLNFSNGWLDKFQKRHSLPRSKGNAKSAEGQHPIASPNSRSLNDVISGYDIPDIFNADEFGHLYCHTPDYTFFQEITAENRRRDSRKLTYLACCNADGSEKVPLLIIGKAAKPKSFGNKKPTEQGFNYFVNDYAWMTPRIFNEWLPNFSAYISRTGPDRKVLLLVDNCSAHGSPDSIPALSNVEVAYFPPEQTFKLQPLSGGVIAAMKARYRKLHYKFALECIEANLKPIYAIDQLLAMRLVSQIWENIPDQLISNCWKQTGLLGGEVESNLPTSEEGVLSEISDMMKKLIPPTYLSRITAQDVIIPVGEERCIENVDERSLAISALSAMGVRGDESSESDEFDDAPFIDSIPPHERMRAVVVTKRLMLSENINMSEPGSKAICELQNSLRQRERQTSK